MLRQPKAYVMLAVFVHLFVVLGCEQEQEVFSMAGHWQGTADLAQDSVAAVEKTEINLIVTSDSDVLGSIGDASLLPGAILEQNNFAENDYVINGRISGRLPGADSLFDTPVRILVQLKDEKLIGGFSLKTNKIKEKPVTFTGSNMSLRKL
jgi:hypothetical protein